jgi:hypothetical protein
MALEVMSPGPHYFPRRLVVHGVINLLQRIDALPCHQFALGTALTSTSRTKHSFISINWRGKFTLPSIEAS